MAQERNEYLDILKGIGILLMVVGHNPIPNLLNSFIFSFHMPMFFFISGYLFKRKKISYVIESNAKKVLLPYFVTGLFLCFLRSIKGDYLWGLSLLLANGSYPVWNFKGYAVGPLWFLVCYFVAIIGFTLLLRINEKYRLSILLGLWIAANVYKSYFNLLPFDILNSIPAIVCLYLGFLTKNNSIREKASSLLYMIIGTIIWVVCISIGELSMASFIYRLWIFEIIGAYYGTMWVYKIITYAPHLSKKCRLMSTFSFIGRNSLILLCAHSVDLLLGISSHFVDLMSIDSSIRCLFLITMNIVFIFFVYFIMKQFKITRILYLIQK